MSSEKRPLGKVWLVGAGPGDPDLITCRGRAALEQAEVVLYDALSHPELLAHAKDAEHRNVGKRYGERSPAQELITQEILDFARQGKRVVRLKGGDPMLFARGGEEALALHQAGIPFEIIPGIASPMAAAEFAGIPLTHRDLSSSVTFITGSDQEGKEWTKDAWTRLATATGTICVLMGVRRIHEITQAIIEGGRDPKTPTAVVRWAARPEQRTIVAPLDAIAEVAERAGMTSPAVIIIGEVVGLRESLAWYDTKPLYSQRILIPRASAQAASTVALVRARGAEPIVARAIEIHPPPSAAELRSAVRAASSYDWVVFTSQNGVEAFFRELHESGLDARAFGAAKIAVIGPKTAEELRQRGLVADLIAKEYVAESLLSDLLSVNPRPKRVLLARALDARDVLPSELRARGVDVQVVAAYETQPATGATAEALAQAARHATAILLTSSSIVRSLVTALGQERALLSEKILVSIGPITTATARELGLTVHVEAARFTVEGALDALEEFLDRAK